MFDMMRKVSIERCRSVRKRNLLDGIQLEILSKLMMFKSMRFSENILIDPFS
jgi:hypothetical protein